MASNSIITVSKIEKAVLLSIVLGLYLTEPLQEMRVVLVFVVIVALVEGFQWAKISSSVNAKRLTTSSTKLQQAATVVLPSSDGASELRMPNIAESETTAKSTGAGINLNEMRKYIPEEAFQKSLPKSLFYLGFDYTMWGGSLLAIHTLVNSALWPTLPFWLQGLASVLYWNVAGFFMWCIFVVGHDCGHTTFSKHTWLNNILGHITHGSLLVPFFPWQLSHRRHHMYHNHVTKDYSYAWYTKDMLDKEEAWHMKLFHELPIVSFFMPFYGWFIYLLGAGDGSHFLPIKSHRLWQQTPVVEMQKCLISSASVLAFAALNYFVFQKSLAQMAYYFLAPLVMFGWWLVTVTYLQHHHEDSVVYDETDWKFAEAGLETVDREYGWGIDKLHHYITNHHVAHHLFFTQIPHYNLPLATEGIKKYLAAQNKLHLYRFEETRNFAWRVHSLLVRHGFKAKKASEISVEDKTK